MERITIPVAQREELGTIPEFESRVVPVVARLKAKPSLLSGPRIGSTEKDRRKYEASVIDELEQFWEDKGYDRDALKALRERGILYTLFSELVLRQSRTLSISTESAIDTTLYTPSAVFGRRSTPRYRGTPQENMQIDNSIATSKEVDINERRRHAGHGATRIFSFGFLERPRTEPYLSGVPVVVIGAGPAGKMATRGLIELGFRPQDITVIDKLGKYNGIWNLRNVYGGSKNNPVPFQFAGINLSEAPGLGKSVVKFLEGLDGKDDGKHYFARELPRPIKGSVTEVVPGDLQHSVKYQTKEGSRTITAPIVINALGNGLPLNPNREDIMTTDTPEKAGIRWQQVLTKEGAERLRGKRVIFIGLGNSTAEMLIQIQRYNEQGYDIDYRVISHYPQEAVINPDLDVIKEGKKYRVFRNLAKSNLTKWEGDLPDANAAYHTALSEGKIIADVAHWHAEDGVFTVTLRNGEQQAIDYYQQYTLIGYGNDSEALRAMGMTVTDDYLGSVAYDYDAEIQSNPGVVGRNRVYPGYFGLGAVLRSKENQNAVVMPGIMHRMYDLLFAAAIRANEYKQMQAA